MLFPHLPSSLSLFRNAYRSARRPSRLTLGVAAASAAAVAGVSAGLSAGAASPAGPAGRPAVVSHAGPVRQEATDKVPARRAHQPRLGRLVSKEQPAAAQHRASGPYLIYDSVTPSAIPSGHMIATYATGGYAVSPAVVAGRGPVMWIDTIGTDYGASALDVEPTDATPSVAANWAFQRLSAHPHAVAHIYTMLSEWPAVQAAVAALPGWMQSHIRWWIADPTGVPHVVPGSDATQWYWGSNYDISTATPRF